MPVERLRRRPIDACAKIRAGSCSVGRGSPTANVVYVLQHGSMDYRDIITVEPGKRGGRPCIRGLRITVYDVLGYLASGMTTEEILDDFPYLTEDDIRASLRYAAERERNSRVVHP